MTTATSTSGHSFKITLILSLPLLLLAAPAWAQDGPPQVEVIQAERFDELSSLRDVAPGDVAPQRDDYEIPNNELPQRFQKSRALGEDPVRQRFGGQRYTNPPTRNIDGLGVTDNEDVIGQRVAPPDPELDVGEDYVVQMANLLFAVYDKDTGDLVYGPVENNAVFDGFGGDCEFENSGDPIALYDQAAERWLISNMSFNGDNPGTECIAISQTSDPTGAWYRYEFVISETANNDYPKLGVGPDAYYSSYNMFEAGFTGGKVAAHDRQAMINGDPNATAIMFGPNSAWFTLMPADIDGAVPSPSPGGLFTQISQDQLDIYQFEPDFDTPDNSTFEEIAELSTAAFDSQLCGATRGRCVSQPNGPDLEDLAGRLMQRLQFRDMGSYQSMVVNHTVDADGAGTAGIRWYELRDETENGNWEIHQQGTYAPDDGEHRWMASAAKNEDGSIGLIYTVSSDTTHPSIRYTGRPEGAPLGQMTFEEETIFEASASQQGSNRWGDYSALDIDPSNGTTFWGTHEHGADIAGQFNWDTRVAAFEFDPDDDTPPHAITDLSADSSGTTTVGLSWTAPADPPGGDPAAGYDLRYATDSIEGNQDFQNAQQVEDLPMPSDSGEVDSATATGLQPDTEYFFAIKSVDNAGNSSALSNVVSATTAAAPIIAVNPEEVTKTLSVGESGSDVLSIVNVGEDTLTFTQQPDLRGSEVSDPLGTTAPDAAAGNYPERNAEPTTGPVPEGQGPLEGLAPSRTLNPDLEGTTYVGVNYNYDTTPASSNLVSFSGDAPEELTVVGDYPASDPFSNAGDFPHDDNSFVYELDNQGTLRTFNVETGDVNELGAVGPNGWTGMSTDPSTGDLYAITGTALYTLDPDNVEVEQVGTFGVDLMIDIAIDEEGTMYGYSVSTDVLYEIDKETGEATEIGAIGFDANAGQGLTWDTQNGVLLMSAFNDATTQAEFRSVDRETGNTELIGVIGENAPGGTNQMGWIATPIESVGEWLTTTPSQGEVAAGESQDVELFFGTTFDAEDEDDLVGGLDYLADVVIESNDPSTPVREVPVTLTVEGTPAIGFSDDPLDFGEVFAGTSSSDTLTVFNESTDAILQVADLQVEGEAFSLVDSTSFVLDPGESMNLPITFSPDASTTFEGTLSLASSAGDQEVDLVGEGVPFVSIEPDQLEQDIDLTTGDSTATQTFTVTNEFDESLSFSVLVEALQTGGTMDVFPKLADEELRRWRQMQKVPPRSSSDLELSMKAVPDGETSGGQRAEVGRSLSERVLSGPQANAATDVTGYANDLVEENIVSFDLGVPGELTVLDGGVDSYAGNFIFGNNDQIFWIDNADNSLKTYALDDGSVEEVGELEPENSDEGWTDLETDHTSGTSYVTTAVDPGSGFITRLYELDPQDAELSFVGEFSGLGIALAIDDKGDAYVHEIGADEILSLDLETAEAETIGSTGIDANYAQSMTWDGETGQLLMAAYHDCTIVGCNSGTLRQVDRETGETTLIGPFEDGGQNEMGWFATPGQGVPWLATNLEKATIPAGATLTLQANFDASDQVEGEYEAQISVVGEELEGEPRESLPVTLTVEGEPVLFLSKDELSFGELFVNDTSSTQMVTLRNDGAANMNISDVSIDSEHFTVDGESAFTLEPGEAKILDVAFTPQDVGEFTAALSVQGDDVSGEVALMGEGIPAPELAVEPESFEKQAFLGQQQEETVLVSNEGGNPLEYDLSILPTQPPTQDVYVDETFDGDFPPENWSRSGANDGENWTTDCFGGPEEILPAAVFCWSPSIEGTQRFMSPTIDTEGLSEVMVEFTHMIDVYASDPAFELRLETSSDGGQTWTTVADIPEEELSTTEERIVVDNADVGSSDFQVAWTFEGDSFDINEWAVGEASIFAEGEFLAVEPEQGTLAPGESDSLQLSIDAGVPGLEEGTFESGINFATNDPLAKSFDLPFILHVIEELTVQPNPEKEEVYPNEPFGIDFGVESLDDLDVFSYELKMDYNADRVTVDSVVTDGTLSEGLTLSSNIDNEAGTLTIVAADDGQSSPSGESPELFQIEGEGTLVSVDAQAQPDHGEVTLDLTKMVFNEGEPPATAKDSTIEVVPLYGDVDLNLSVTASDALSTLDFVVGKTDLSEVQKTHADVSGDGNVSAYDASLILRYTVGGIDCFPVEPSCDASEPTLASRSSSSTSSGESGLSFAWGEATQSEKANSKSDEDAGTTVSLPLVLDQAVWDDSYGAIRSVEVTSEIDPEKVAVEDMEAQLPNDWQSVHHVSEDGTLKISMAGTTPLAKVGKLATVRLQRKERDAEIEMGGSVAVNEGSTQELEATSLVSIPDEFALQGTYPNPFRQAATLEMDLPQKTDVTVEVYDLLGRKVKTAHTGEMAAGVGRTVRIDGTDLSSGTYFYRVRAEMGDNRRVESGKMTVVQ